MAAVAVDVVDPTLPEKPIQLGGEVNVRELRSAISYHSVLDVPEVLSVIVDLRRQFLIVKFRRQLMCHRARNDNSRLPVCPRRQLDNTCLMVSNSMTSGLGHSLSSRCTKTK